MLDALAGLLADLLELGAGLGTHDSERMNAITLPNNEEAVGRFFDALPESIDGLDMRHRSLMEAVYGDGETEARVVARSLERDGRDLRSYLGAVVSERPDGDRVEDSDLGNEIVHVLISEESSGRCSLMWGAREGTWLFELVANSQQALDTMAEAVSAALRETA